MQTHGNHFEVYKQKLDMLATNISKMHVNNINQELINLDHMRIPAYEKYIVKGTIYNKLSNSKKAKLFNHFGEIASSTTPVVTVQPIQSTQPTIQPTLPVAVAPVVQPTIQPLAKAVIPSQQIAVPSVQQASIIGGTNYNTAAGAIGAAANALQLAGAQVTALSAAQGNISGFGSYRRR